MTSVGFIVNIYSIYPLWVWSDRRFISSFAAVRNKVILIHAELHAHQSEYIYLADVYLYKGWFYVRKYASFFREKTTSCTRIVANRRKIYFLSSHPEVGEYENITNSLHEPSESRDLNFTFFHFFRCLKINSTQLWSSQLKI